VCSSDLASGRFDESNYYYFNFTIEKVFVHRLGYVVNYRTGSNRITTTYIPHDWFNTIGGRGEVIGLGSGTEWPSMIVYYKDGEFAHVRLRLRQNRLHETWGDVPLNANIDDHFLNVIDEIKVEF
jgi:hypothetical protein